MKAALKTFLVLLGVFAAVFSLSADELDVYTTQLDRAERNFWLAAFSSSNSSGRKAYKSSLDLLERSARKIEDWRRKNDSRINYGDLKRPAVLLDRLLINHQAFKKRIGISGLYLTTLDDVGKVLRKKGVNSRQRIMTEADISLEQYKECLDFIRDDNLDKLTKKFVSNNELRHYQQDVLVQTAQKFYTIIIDARLTVFKLRKKDPLFQRQNKYGNNRR